MEGVDDASESLLARVNLVSYDGAIGLDLPILMAGTTTIGAESQILGTGLTLLWRPVLDSGDKWSWAAAATIPWVWVDVTADVNVLGPRGRQVSKEITPSANGLGDIIFMPLMLNYKASDDFSINFRLAAYAPTGDYEVGRPANRGRNYWSFEPPLGFFYFGKKSGIEASLYTG
ncbi:MAG: hypothetical protein DVB22_002367 [Verrucomicrobia bacterium]|nr:MAG: hypothetical protein DVB22_002367 [Verrucomicrobiota bacterium]